LGISGIYSIASTFYKKGTTSEKGIQIDLIIDRNDHVINLFEIKFYNKEFVMTKSYAETLQQKAWQFEEITKTKKQIFWVFLTTFGVRENEHSLGVISHELVLGDLF